MHPDESGNKLRVWDWYSISRNPILTMEYVDNHPDRPWNWDAISENPNLTMEYVQHHPEIPWNWYGIGRNLFSLHPAVRKRLPNISEEQRALLWELHEKFDVPPMVDSRPVFRNGGKGYWEGWTTVKELVCHDLMG